MSERIATAGPGLDEQGRVAADVACRRCGYNLRGLPAARACPECRTPVERSLRSDLLANSDPAWVRRIASGVLVLQFSAGAVWALSAWQVCAWLLVQSPFLRALTFAAWAAVWGASLLGAWLATARDPAAGPEPPGSARRAVRGFAAAIFVLRPATDLIVAAGGAVPGAWALGGAALAIAGYLSLLVYLRELARRLPDPDLERLTRSLAWGLGATVVGLVALAAIFAGLAGLRGSSPFQNLAFGLTAGSFGFAALALAVFVWLSLGLLGRYRRSLRAAAAAAVAAWAQDATDSAVR